VREGKIGVEKDPFTRPGPAYRGMTSEGYEATVGAGVGVVALLLFMVFGGRK